MGPSHSRQFRLKVAALVLALALALAGIVYAAPGALLATVTLPGNGSCNVGITTDGNLVVVVQGSGCASSTLGVYDPPAASGAATLVATKTVKVGGVATAVSAVDWDAGRSSPGHMMLWGAYGNNVYLIDIGDPFFSGDAPATLKFTFAHGGYPLIDGLAYDASDDTIYLSPDVNCNVYHLSTAGALLHTVTPKNAAGQSDCRVSGVAVGSPLGDGTKTLYIGRDGAAQIRRIKTPSGDWLADFATTSGRVEDLVCDPVTYAPLEAILAKDAYQARYEAFEVEAGTCPLQGEVAFTQGFWKTHPEDWTHLAPGDKPAWGGDKTYMEILWMAPKNGDASLILAHAYIAALLNTGAPAAALADAATLLADHPIGSDKLTARGSHVRPVDDGHRASALTVAETLQAFNESQ